MTTEPLDAPAAPGADALVEFSIRRYRRAHRRYERRHPEIFNPIEQARLREQLQLALADLRTDARPPRVLDLGCGSGNLTRHLLELGARVVAADVSPEFLARVERRFGATGRLETLRLNGTDLAQLGDGSCDMVCAYSVLHHIPDYLGAVEEAARVVAPGGIVFLDHEVNEAFWDKSGCFWRMLALAAEARVARRNRWNGRGWWHPEAKRWQRFLQPSRYVLRVRRHFNPAYPWDVEGDIHVWEEDHIEWDRVEDRLRAAGCDVVRRVDYLNYSREYPEELWARFAADGCTSMRLLVARRS